MRIRPSFLPLAVASALVLAACGGGGSSGTESRPDDTSGNSVEVVADPTTTVAATADSTPTEEPTVDTEVATDPRCAVKNEAGGYDDVSCDEPHDAEFAGLVAAPDGIVPDDADELADLVAAACAPAVEALTDRSTTLFGIVIGAATDDAPGAEFTSDVECWAEVSAEGTLTDSIAAAGLDAALGDFVLLADIAPGECFALADEQLDSYDVGTVISCDEVGAEMVVDVVEAGADAPAPATGDDISAVGDELCSAAAENADFELLGDATSYVFPLETEWNELGVRSFICTSYRSGDFDTDFDTDSGAESIVDSVCSIQIPDVGHDPVPCDEPHDSEFVGAPAPPEGLLPDDPFEAEVLMKRHCAPLVSEFLGGRDLSTPGIGVGFEANTGLGEPFGDSVNCFAVVGSPVALDASIAEVGLDAALGEFSILAELDPGTCFTFAPDSFDLGVAVECDIPDALMAVGSFVVDDDGPHPGDDALRELRSERCSEILGESGLDVDPASISGTFPGENVWTSLDQRTITCDATPL